MQTNKIKILIVEKKNKNNKEVGWAFWKYVVEWAT